MTEKLDIVQLIDDSSSVMGEYEDKVFKKIKENFTTEEEQMFVASFKCYLRYNAKIDFVIELNKLWKWLGYSRIDPCKVVLLKNFKQNIDYKIEKAAPEISGAGPKLSEEGKNLGGAGLNKETILLTINCFKKLCLKSKTEKADKIHDYYIKLEETLHEAMKEESNELKKQLLDTQSQLILKNKEIENVASKNERELLLKHNKKRCFYLILINTPFNNKKIVKFGITNDIVKRLSDHKRDISEDILLIYVLETVYNSVIEKKIKELCSDENDILFGKRVSIEFNSKIQTELISLDKLLTVEQLWDKVLKIEKNINKDELFSEMEKKIEILEMKKDKISEEETTNYDYIYLLSTNTVNQYIIDLTNDITKSKDIYASPNAKLAKKLAYLLLEAYQVKDNIFELPYNAIKSTLEYSIITYDNYKINKNDINRFSYIERYVTRHREDCHIIKEAKEIISIEMYKRYISNRIEFGQKYKVPVIKLYEDLLNWYEENYPNNELELRSVSEKDLKEDIVKNFTKLTNKEKNFINVTDTKGQRFSSYIGFEGFRIKEAKNSIYSEEIYEEFIEEFLEYTGNKNDKVLRPVLIEKFMDFVEGKYEIKEGTKGKERYTISFLREFDNMIKKFLDIDFNKELRARINGSHLHGGYLGCKLIE